MVLVAVFVRTDHAVLPWLHNFEETIVDMCSGV